MTPYLHQFSRALRAALDLDERAVAYNFCQPVQNILVRGIPKPRYSLLPVRVLVFLLRVWRNVQRTPAARSPARVLFFADTVNQFKSLNGLRHALQGRGVLASFVISPEMQATSETLDATILRAGVADAVTSTVCGLLTLPRLWWRLRALPGTSAAFLDKFLDAHRFLPCFMRILEEVQPQIVVLANDHNTSCRLLARLARGAGAATLYLQHAQVSDQFPPLDYSYVFLDGEVALQTYAAIAQRSGVTAGAARVFLNGEKKTKPERDVTRGAATVGVAVSPVDRPEKIVPLIRSIASDDRLQVRIRPHPATPQPLLSALDAACSLLQNASVVPPRAEAVSVFLDRLSYLIGGDSSIHMDALLRGVPSFYAVLHDEPHLMDYYGFLRHGVVPSLPASADADWSRLADGYQFSVAAIQRYSATYQTTWQGREEVLAALTVQALLDGDFAGIERLYPRKVPVADAALGLDCVRAPV